MSNEERIAVEETFKAYTQLATALEDDLNRALGLSNSNYNLPNPDHARMKGKIDGCRTVLAGLIREHITDL